MSIYSKLTRILLAAVVGIVIVLFITNEDIAIRMYQALRDGSLTLEKVRYEIAAFDIGQTSSVTPINIKVSPKDGMTQLFVPAGEFAMGKEGEPDENSPQHIVYLDAFWVDQVEVTNAMYKICVKAEGCVLPAISRDSYYEKWAYRDYPVVYVSWYQADDYCKWAGRRLLTEAEWEKAARGTDKRRYPWGYTLPNPRLANYSDSLIGESVSVYRYPLGASPYGALNMVGNVREWLADWYSITYYSISPYMNPKGPPTGTERSLRSGAYDADARGILTTTRYKHEPQSAGLSRGFRCAESGN